MPFALLNNIDHKELKVITRYSAEYGQNVSTALTFPTEFGHVSKEYPIFLKKQQNAKQFSAVALLGIGQDENLFLDEGGWHANYVPASVAKGPFAIGFQDQSADGGDEKAPVLHIDLDDLRVSSEEGHDLFLEFGGHSDYLNHVSYLLKNLYDGVAISQAMYQRFEQLGLIEPVDLAIELQNGEKHRLHGNYTVSEEKLAALNADDLHQLHQQGFLQSAFLLINSLSNIERLVNMKNRQLVS
jgi:hypothetical protein